AATLSLYSDRGRPPPLSFPTRRSSDLPDGTHLGQRRHRHGVGAHLAEAGGDRVLRRGVGGLEQGRRAFARLVQRELRLGRGHVVDRKSTRLNSSHVKISYAVFCLKKKR